MRRITLLMILMTLATFGVSRTGVAQDEATVEPTAVRDLAEQARSALEAGEYDQAMRRYQQLRQRLPQSAEVPYNMGVAAFRAGDYERAAELFAQALSMAGDRKLRSDSAYNLGTSAYARSLQADAPGAVPLNEQMDQAQRELQRALQHYRQALDLAPQDDDARANAELAYRRLKALQQMQREMKQTQNQQGEHQQDQNQQQQQQQQDQSDDQDDESDDRDRNRNDQNRPQEQSQQQQNQQQNRQSSPRSDQPQPQQQQQSDDEQPGGTHQQREPNPLEPEGQPQPQPRPHDDDERMSREEAEGLLQLIRDKQRERRQQQKQQQSSRLPDVDKDW